MPLKLPKANTMFGSLTNTNLSVQAQAIKAGLASAVADFPTPPITPGALQPLIDAYNSALALATGPGAGKVNTANMQAAKLNLKNALRADQQYVNTVIYTMAQGGASYADLQALILTTGYFLNKQPAPAGVLPGPTLIKYASRQKGQFYMLAQKVPGATGYEVIIFDETDNKQSPNQSFPGTRMTVLGLVSGHMYSFSLASIGANPLRNFDNTYSGNVIL